MNDRYYFPDNGETEEDARESPVKKHRTEGNSWAAEECATHWHSNGSGWEADWPVVLVLLRDGEPPTKWKVDRVMMPEFHAEKQE